ncbi:hypothetical protein AYI82_16380 [Shewanella algae]|uniref:hypothetical protein n=1 Tax=Shewanella algae TaxID=38313 RepID=UPI0011839484|nr:hypothetical protein [Shewanella algae]TVL06245.1 hypothetical protein AYI82_16380 [Shewanella algae]
MALFVSAEQLDGVSVKKLDDFLIDRLIEQTNEAPNELLKSRWRHRLQAWKSAPPQAQLLVVIDGLNQRQYIRWDRLLNEIQSILAEIGGRLIVTSRPHFWRTKIERGLTFNPTVIEVPEWSPAERNTLLAYYDISVDWLDKPTLKTLQNPRLLSIAVATLPHRKPIVWEGLTTNRLLMEHLRASQRENFEDETFDQLTMRLSVHAKEVLHRVQSSSNIPPHNFQADSNAVIETRFYRPIRGPGGQYELREEGLTLALGFALVDQLWQTLRAQQDLVERINKLLDPVRAMDRTTDVLFASLLICALDDITFDTEIFSALLDAFANLQNVDDHRFEELVGIVMHQPKALYDVLKTLCLERSRRINKDWFIHAAFEVAKSKKGWQAAEAAIHQWLRCYNKNHLEQINRYNKRNDAEYKKRLEEKESEIREVLSSLSAFEKQTLDQMTEVLNEIDELHTLALRLLAGRSLVSFADSFVAMGLAFALDRDVHSARKAFQQLTTFNRIARSATRVSFKRAIEPLCNVKTSKGGQWTVVRMLCATGDEADATIANTIAEKLRKNWEFFSPPSPDKWRQAEVANPEATRPIDMDEGIQLFNSLEPSKLLQTMGIGSEDHYFREFLAVACRFESAIAVEKTRAVLTGMLTRSGFPLRQVILNCGAHVPLVTTDLADNVINRVEQSEVFETLPENEQLICRMYVFYYIAAQISADDQLRCMTSNNFGSNYLLKAIPSFKPQSTSKIVSVLKDALKRRNENSVYSALTAALYGTTQINTELEKLILQCSRCNSSMIRSVSYQLALKKRLDSIRHSHTKSNWNGTSISEKTDEYWYGSMLLVEACYRNELSIEELLNRITYKTWFASSNRLDTEFTIPMVDSFLKKLRNGVAMAKKIELPFANLEFSRIEYSPYPFVSIEESSRENKRFTKESNIEDTFGADGYFEKKQNKLNSEANIFFSKLKESDAKLLIQEITIENLKNIIVKVPSIEADLLHILEQVDNVQFIWFKNLAFALANLISKKDPERAVSILNRACSSQCFITITLGDDLTLEHQAIWGCSASSSIEKLWRQRLLSAENDAVLAREILAAERFGATDFVKSLIQEFASSEDNLDQAYAISITGYSTHSSEFIDIVSKHMNETGLCAKAAKYAYSEHEKAKWTQEWIEKMWKAATPEEFWRNLTIAKNLHGRKG